MLRRQRARKQRFREKKTAEKANSPKSPISEVNTAILQEQEPNVVLQEQEPPAVLQEPEPACVTSTKDSCDLDNTCRVHDLTSCSSDKRYEKQVLSPDFDISVETERAFLLEFLQQTDTGGEDNSFEMSKVISEVKACSNCKRQPLAGA